jgi:hypothetical protein
VDTFAESDKGQYEQMGHPKKENGLYQRINVPVGK